jgi:hypothetical protein
MVLVLAIGTVFISDSTKATSLRANARQWVYAAQQWLSAPLEKSRVSIRGLQIQCLLILARETIGIGSDLIWTSIGTLIRTAMQLGHRDPQTFYGMSPLHAEMRVQAAFNSAMPPLISLDDFDTGPSLNINDDEIGKSTETPPIPQAPNIYTQTALQLHLHRSFPARLEAIRLSSSFPWRPILRPCLETRKRDIRLIPLSIHPQCYSTDTLPPQPPRSPSPVAYYLRCIALGSSK